MINNYSLTMTTSGSAGSATGSATTTRPVNGRLVAVHIDYTSQPATTDVTLTCVHSASGSAPSKTLLTVSNTNTDAWFYPRQLMDGTTGAALTAIYDLLPLSGYVTASVAQGDAITSGVVVTILVEEA